MTAFTGSQSTGSWSIGQSDRCGVPKADRKLLESVWDEAAPAPALARVACAIGLDAERTDDVLQDVYLTAWKKCPHSVDRGELRRWLFRVTINRCHLEHRPS